MAAHQQESLVDTTSDDGFTLIELLVVVIIIAILAAIAIPTYLGTRARAQDAAAVTLVRNALTVVESANIDLHDYLLISADDLAAIEPAMKWTRTSEDLVDPTVPMVSVAVTSLARENAVDFHPQESDIFDIASRSDSGNRYGIQVHVYGANSGTEYVKVKVVGGDSTLGW